MAGAKARFTTTSWDGHCSPMRLVTFGIGVFGGCEEASPDEFGPATLNSPPQPPLLGHGFGDLTWSFDVLRHGFSSCRRFYSPENSHGHLDHPWYTGTWLLIPKRDSLGLVTSRTWTCKEDDFSFTTRRGFQDPCCVFPRGKTKILSIQLRRLLLL